ncbi:Sentrin-specific protease 1 [Frankliniella fusca]|uniref:Sentrin-specific protease 1 n=1 Tax=Frankliniella fusca TaxID=407009 RepID=A0AAE1I5N7_9NEOP|nr:Sentrin-specific protease 1 [Frankliniella fusca]
MVKTRSPSSRKPPKKEYGSPRQVAVLVAHHPCLWDPTHPLYRNLGATEAAWQDISKYFNGTLSAEKCKRDWKLIRQSRANYAKAKEKRCASGSAAQRAGRPFKYEKETSFLDGLKINNDEQLGNLQNIAEESTDDDDDDDDDKDNDDDDDKDDDDDDKDDDDKDDNCSDGSETDFHLTDSEHEMKSQSAMEYSNEMADLSYEEREKFRMEKLNMAFAGSQESDLGSTQNNDIPRSPLKNINRNGQNSQRTPGKHQSKQRNGNRRACGKENRKTMKTRPKSSKPEWNSQGDWFNDEDYEIAVDEGRDVGKAAGKRKSKLQMKMEARDVCKRLEQLQIDRIVCEFWNRVSDALQKPSNKKSQDHMFPTVTAEMKQMINASFDCGEDEVVANYAGYVIRGHDFQTLKPTGWLNDVIIDLYMKFVSSVNKKTKTHAFSCHFVSALFAHGIAGYKADLKTKIDFGTYDNVIVPFCNNDHWSLVFVDVNKKKITAYDSLKRKHHGVLELLKRYFEEVGSWSTGHAEAEDIPRQSNAYDCGVFICMYAKCLAQGENMKFSQEVMPHLRCVLAYEVLTSKLLPL